MNYTYAICIEKGTNTIQNVKAIKCDNANFQNNITENDWIVCIAYISPKYDILNNLNGVLCLSNNIYYNDIYIGKKVNGSGNAKYIDGSDIKFSHNTETDILTCTYKIQYIFLDDGYILCGDTSYKTITAEFAKNNSYIFLYDYARKNLVITKIGYIHIPYNTTYKHYIGINTDTLIYLFTIYFSADTIKPFGAPAIINKITVDNTLLLYDTNGEFINNKLGNATSDYISILKNNFEPNQKLEYDSSTGLVKFTGTYLFMDKIRYIVLSQHPLLKSQGIDIQQGIIDASPSKLGYKTGQTILFIYNITDQEIRVYSETQPEIKKNDVFLFSVWATVYKTVDEETGEETIYNLHNERWFMPEVLRDIFYIDGVKYKQDNDSTNINIKSEGKIYEMSDFGLVDYCPIDYADYNHIIIYGQSLSQGYQAPEAITKTAINNCYMIGDSPIIDYDNDGSQVLNPLIARRVSNVIGEQPIVSATHAFSRLYNRFSNNHDQKFIGTSCGRDGRSIEHLSKESTNGTNFYTTSFLKALNSAKSITEAQNKSIACSAIIYMQGEYNYVNLAGHGLTSSEDATNTVEGYKSLLLTLKNNMQQDVMRIYNQDKPPLFFIYQVAGSYINNKEMTINQAQYQFAEENDDVILLNGTYGVPDYNGGHLSTNGYRWYGELIAKSMYKIFIKNQYSYAVHMREIEIDDKNIYIHCQVPVLPLVIDTWTKETQSNYGFRVYQNNTEVSISNVTINLNTIILTCASSLSGTIEIVYGGQGRSGSGNIRDSDEFLSMYNYYDDRETVTLHETYTPKDKDGNYIYGKHYPLYNWLDQFYYKVTI